MARTGLAVGGVALILVGAGIAFGWVWPSSAEATETVTERVTRIELATDSGDVRIRVDPDARATTVGQSLTYRWGRHDNAYVVLGSTLRLHGCGDWCSVDYDVVVPPGTAVSGAGDSGDLTLEGVASVDVLTGSGDVTVHDVAGPVAVGADSGNVELHRLSGTVRVEGDSGNIQGEELAAPVEATMSSGDVTLALTAPRSVTASVESGNIDLSVPEGAYRVEGDTESGERNIDVVVDGSSPNTLDLNASSGDITVRGK
ncbi:DUF4097 family beta strand repeat-containing protein [Prauserella oleivorans]|uniref:DUF4097 family beta strand repeat-containing protein n=1 Tax=Prauserella oleivorans TaxID=1478153 RepID=A0ABW5WFX8_9PSEU